MAAQARAGNPFLAPCASTRQSGQEMGLPQVAADLFLCCPIHSKLAARCPPGMACVQALSDGPIVRAAGAAAAGTMTSERSSTPTSPGAYMTAPRIAGLPLPSAAWQAMTTAGQRAPIRDHPALLPRAAHYQAHRLRRHREALMSRADGDRTGVSGPQDARADARWLSAARPGWCRDPR